MKGIYDLDILRCLINAPNSEINIKASEVVRVVNKNTWNVEDISPAEFISAEVDGFRPE